MARGSSPESPGRRAHDFLGLLYCFIVLLCIFVVSCPCVIYYPTVMARYSLFVVKVPLNPSKQTNKQTRTTLFSFVVFFHCLTLGCSSLVAID